MEAQENTARAQQLAARPYTFTLVRDDDHGWTSGVLEVPGVISEGDDANEAIEMAEDALREVIASLLEDGLDVPEPLQARDFSGRLQLRLNPELHRRASMLAAEEGVSLNRWLSAAIARAGGAADADAALAAVAYAALIRDERVASVEAVRPYLEQALREFEADYRTDREADA